MGLEDRMYHLISFTDFNDHLFAPLWFNEHK